MQQKLTVTCTALALLVGASGSAHAEAQSTSACFGAMSHEEVIEIAEGHVFIHVRSEHTGNVTDDRNDPHYGAAGSSYGTIEIRDGAVSGGGYAAYTDTDGDEYIVAWEPSELTEAGQTAGTWEFVSGTGKWDGTTGSGTWQGQPQAKPDRSIICWEGELEMAG